MKNDKTHVDVLCLRENISHIPSGFMQHIEADTSTADTVLVVSVDLGPSPPTDTINEKWGRVQFRRKRSCRWWSLPKSGN